MGQVAAAQIGVQLQTLKTRRGASLQVAFRSPLTTTGQIYLLNKNTNAYDLMNTVPGTGSMTTMTLALDVSTTGDKYITDAGTVGVLIRALRPSRLGSAPFTLDVNQVTTTERVSRGQVFRPSGR